MSKEKKAPKKPCERPLFTARAKKKVDHKFSAGLAKRIAEAKKGADNAS